MCGKNVLARSDNEDWEFTALTTMGGGSRNPILTKNLAADEVGSRRAGRR